MDKKKKPNSMLAYTRGVSDADKAKTDSYYNKKFSKVVDESNKNYRGALDALFDPNEAKDKEYRDRQDKASIAADRLPGEKAYQKSWINKGAKANALAQMKLKKKGK